MDERKNQTIKLKRSLTKISNPHLSTILIGNNKVVIMTYWLKGSGIDLKDCQK